MVEIVQCAFYVKNNLWETLVGGSLPLVDRVVLGTVTIVAHGNSWFMGMAAGFLGRQPIGPGVMLLVVLLSWMAEELNHESESSKSYSNSMVLRLINLLAFLRHLVLAVLLAMSFGEVAFQPIVILSSAIILLSLFTSFVYSLLKYTRQVEQASGPESQPLKTDSLWLSHKLYVDGSLDLPISVEEDPKEYPKVIEDDESAWPKP